MITLLVILGLLSLWWLIRQVLASLVGQQIRGSIPDITEALARRAARSLPSELAEVYEEDWLAELDSLEHKPLSAIRFAHGLSNAARKIRAEAGLPAPSRPNAALSRLFDLNVSLVFLAILAPLLIAIGLAIKLDAAGPVFARKRLVGLDGAPFDLLGFRTVRIDSEDEGPAVRGPTKLIPTRLGRFLRRTSLDSVPALINLMRGELALVGPPLQWDKTAMGTLSVRPGVASWQALVEMGGCDIELAEAMRRDRSRSFRTDLRLVALVFRFGMSRHSS